MSRELTVEVVVLEPLGDGLSEEEGLRVGDVATHGIAVAVRSERIGSVANGLDVDTLSRQQGDVPLIGGDACEDVLRGNHP